MPEPGRLICHGFPRDFDIGFNNGGFQFMKIFKIMSVVNIT